MLINVLCSKCWNFMSLFSSWFGFQHINAQLFDSFAKNDFSGEYSVHYTLCR